MTFNGSGANENFRLSANGRAAVRDVGPSRWTSTASSASRQLAGGNDVLYRRPRATRCAVDHDQAAAISAAPDAGTDQTIINATNANDAIAAAGAPMYQR
jgi:hypothetical protein